MAQEREPKVKALRAKLEASGKKLPKEIWGRVEMIEHDLNYPMDEDEVGMDKLLADVDKLLQEDDIEGLSKRLKGFAAALHYTWQMRANTFITAAIFTKR